MANIFDTLDAKMPEIRASVRRDLQKRIDDGALVASIRSGRLHLETVIKSETDVDATLMPLSAPPALTVWRKPHGIMRLSEVRAQPNKATALT